MPQNDMSWSLEDDSWRKTTCHAEMLGRREGFLLSPQHSVLIFPETKNF